MRFTPLAHCGVLVLWGATSIAQPSTYGSNWNDAPPNPTSSPVAPLVQIWSVPFEGGVPQLLAEGDDPVMSPKGDVVAFVAGGQVWVAPIDGSAPAKKLFWAKGTRPGRSGPPPQPPETHGSFGRLPKLSAVRCPRLTAAQTWGGEPEAASRSCPTKTAGRICIRSLSAEESRFF